jgi:hypothetical protein
VVGDERNKEDIERVKQIGTFDVIIDDASHQPEDQSRLFEWLWPSVAGYGWYVIEDIYRTFNGNFTERCVPVDLESRLHQQRDISEIHWYTNIVFLRKAGK